MLIPTHELVPGQIPSTQQVYNALDCCLTFEIFTELSKLPSTPIYSFARALQAPALEMMLRGFRVNLKTRAQGAEKLREELAFTNSCLQQLAFAVWGKPLNARSTQQLQKFFYQTLHLPEQWISQKGVRKLAMNREVLEKLDLYLWARPLISCILHIRDLSKQLEFLETEIDPDSRFRTSFNICGTESGRWSSSKSSEGSGSNVQNIAPGLRQMFEADPGHYLCAIDLEQAESREVGWLCGILFDEWSYYDACLSGDLHTTAAKLIWPSLDWTGDPKLDRALADVIFYREFSYRDMAKRGGHGSNYLGTPYTMARHLKVPPSLMEHFQRSYFSGFPGIPKWHKYVAQQLQTTQTLTTIFGRSRQFFGRPNDDTTLREAIAFQPQSQTADRLNLILWRIWKHMPEVQLLIQVHDALYFQFPEELNAAEVIQKALGFFSIPIHHHSGRQLLVPGEAKLGWNWGSWSESNPNGLKKFKTQETRTRAQTYSLA